MKKVLRKSISILLSCIMILSCMSVVSIAETPTVTVIKGPSGSYERILYTGTTTYDDIGKMWFNLTLDEGWQEIKVTDSADTELFMATDASGLEVAADSSYFFGIKASSIPAIGDEVLTLSVKYSDEYTYTEDFDVNTYVAYANLAVDMDAATAFSASGLGLTGNDSADAKSASSGAAVTTEFVDGFAGKAPSDKVIKFTNLGQSVSFITKYFFGGIIGDSVVEFDMYYDISAEAGITVIGPKTTTWPQISIARSALPAAYINTWVTVRCVLDSDAKTMTEYIVKDGEIVNTVTTVDLSDDKFTTLFDANGDLKVYGYKIDFLTPSWTEGRINGIDNVKMLQLVSDKADIAYTDANGTYPAFNSIISSDATSVTFTLDPMFVGLGDSYIEKADGTDAGASLSFNANVITLTSALPEGEYSLVVPSSSDVKRNDLFLGGNMKIPFKVADMNEALASTITITAPDSINVGKVITVGASWIEGAQYAQLYFDDELITSDVLESNRYYIDENTQPGNHIISLKVKYPNFAEVVKTATVKVLAKGEAAVLNTIDFEEFNVQDYASASAAQSDLGWFENLKSNSSVLTYAISSDDEYGNTFELRNISNDQLLVGGAFIHVYSDVNSDKVSTYHSNGVLTLEADVYLPSYSGTTLQITPYSKAGYNWTSYNLVNTNNIDGKSGSVKYTAGWNKLSLKFDIDAGTVSGTFGDVELKGKDIAPASAVQGNINYYRVGFRFPKETSCYIDNIKTGWCDSLLRGVTYTQNGSGVGCTGTIPTDATSINFRVTKAYYAPALAENTVLTVNGNKVSVTPKFDSSNKIISIDLTSLNLTDGDKVAISVSPDTRLTTEGLYADEYINYEFTAYDYVDVTAAVSLETVNEASVASGSITVSASKSIDLIAYTAVYNGNKLVDVKIDTVNVVKGIDTYELTDVSMAGALSAKVIVTSTDGITPVVKNATYPEE